MSRPNTLSYKTVNWPEYNKALRRRGGLTIWFDPGMTWAAKPTGKRGRQPIYGDPAIQTRLTKKVLFGMALRQTTGFVESVLQLIGLDWAVPDFSTLSRRQKTLAVTIPFRGSHGPLHLLIDSTGIKVEDEGEWNARKHGGQKRPSPRFLGPVAKPWLDWRKIHIGIDEQTLEIRAVEVTGSDKGDAPMLPEMLAQIPADQGIAGVTADGAYVTRKCHDAIADRGAAAIIPPRRMRSRGRLSPQARSRATKLRGHRNTSAVRSGDVGADITAEAAQRRKCVASNSWGSASWRGTSTARSLSSDSCCRPERLHRAGHPRHKARGTSLSGGRGSPAIS